MNRLNPCAGRKQLVPAEMLPLQSRARPSGWGTTGWGAVRDGEQQDGEQGEDDGEQGDDDVEQWDGEQGSSRRDGVQRLGGISAELGLGVITGGNNCRIIYSPKNVIIFRKVRSKIGRGAARSGAKSTSPERSNERAAIGLRHIARSSAVIIVAQPRSSTPRHHRCHGSREEELWQARLERSD
jgi:hypothetical protein